MMQTLRLREIHECDFRRSEVTNAAECQSLLKRQNDCFVLINRANTQIIFYFAATLLDSGSFVYRSLRLRLVGTGSGGATFSGDMLQHYAEQVGLRFEGLKTLREHLESASSKKERA